MDKLNLIDFDKYTITKNGEIFSNSYNYKGHQLLGTKDRNGYLVLCLRCKDGKPKVYLFHRVIWFYFKGEIPQGYEINHKDEDKTNNSIDNLELLTRKENVNYGTRNKRAAISNSIVQKGRKFTENHLLNISISHSKPILQYNLQTNEPIKEWESIRIAAKNLNYSESTISAVCRGIYKQAYGFGWKFI